MKTSSFLRFSLVPWRSGFRVGSDKVMREIEARVSLVDLRRAFRRVLARLPDEAEAGNEFVIFSVDWNSLGIVAGETSEIVSAIVTQTGQASVPSSCFRGIAGTLRFYRKTAICLTFSTGAITINRTKFRHKNISLRMIFIRMIFIRSNQSATGS